MHVGACTGLACTTQPSHAFLRYRRCPALHPCRLPPSPTSKSMASRNAAVILLLLALGERLQGLLPDRRKLHACSMPSM